MPICKDCNQPKTRLFWCQVCNSKKFQQDFDKWTSGNTLIDKFIQDTQLNARNFNELIEWIPYCNLRNIQFLAQGGFSTVYKAIWLDGHIDKWNNEKNQWYRVVDKVNEEDRKTAKIDNIKSPLKENEYLKKDVVLKSLNNSSNINPDFLKEWKNYLKFVYSADNDRTLSVQLYGITQDPETKNYIVVLSEMKLGNLRNNLMTKKYNPNDKYGNLYYISKALNSLHKCNLIHRDLHSGNLLLSTDMFTHISDLGLSQPADGSTKPDEIYGVLPYIAPEVLRGNPYTKASDIYSFGIIMWEMTSGVPAFSNVPHEFELCYDICRGLRPRIVEGTEVEYVNLMKRCWDGDPENRPTSLELIEYFKKWRHIYKFNYLERVNVPVNELIRHHPKACYTSRRIGYSAKLNEMLLRQSNHHNRFDSQADCILTPEDIENAQTEYFSMNQMMNIENIENN